MTREVINVVVGIIIDSNRKVLLSKRPDGVHQGGKWEFPGGKQESDESVYAALQREIREELDLEITDARPFLNFTYSYSEKNIFFYTWLIKSWSGTPNGREGQPLKWIPMQELSADYMPAANTVIIDALHLPSFYLICPEPNVELPAYLDVLENCLDEGVRLLQLRMRENYYQDNPEFIPLIKKICRKYDARIFLNSSPADALLWQVDGVHLNSIRLLQLNDSIEKMDLRVSASCHNINEIEQAMRINAEFIVLSPVKQTSSHPDVIPLGWSKFSELVNYSNRPVFALGGMRPGDMEKCWSSGAHGLATLGGIWLSSDPRSSLKALINI